MADVLTTVWGFVKQTIGGNRNTWGGILNANFDLVEAGLSGQLSKSVSGGSATLTDAERRNRILSFTGTLASNQTIVVANYPAVWLVRNGTSGAFSLSVKTSAGSAVEVPQGGWSLVWCDGSDVVSVGPSSLLFSTQFKAPDGSISAPGIAFLNETTLGFRRAGYASGTLATNPFTTTDMSQTVSVAHTGHGLATGDYAFYSGATAVGGITIAGLYQITRTDANNYTITHSAAATSSTTGGGTPDYEYMKAAADGGAVAVTRGGADIAHISPYGVILTGSVHVTGDGKIGGDFDVIGALSAASAAISGAFSAATASLTGLLTLSSTSHFLPPRGTTAQRPGTPDQASLRYNTTLDLPEWADSGGNWRQPSIAQPVAAGYKNLVIQNNATTPNTKIDIDADAVTVETSAGIAYRLQNVNLTIDAATTGANGLDQGGLAVDSWYAELVVYNPDTDAAAGLLVKESDFPGSMVLPAGYSAWARLGWHRTDGSANFKKIIQRGRRAQYIDVPLPLMKSGSYGSATGGTLLAVATGAYVPNTASAIHVVLRTTSSNFALAPNSNFGAPTDLTNGCIEGVKIVLTGGSFDLVRSTGVILETTNIYYANDSGNGRLWCSGWEDNL